MAMAAKAMKAKTSKATAATAKGMKRKTKSMKAMKTPAAKVNASQSTLIRVEPAGPTTFDAMNTGMQVQ